MREMQFTTQIGLEATAFELLHGRKPRTDMTNIFKDNRNYFSDWTKLKISVTSIQIPSYVVGNENHEGTDHIAIVRKRLIPCCSNHRSSEMKSVKQFGGTLELPYAFVEKDIPRLPWKIYGEKSVVFLTVSNTRTAVNKTLHWKLISTRGELQKSPKVTLPKKHKLSRPGKKYVSASRKEKKQDQKIISETKPKLQKLSWRMFIKFLSATTSRTENRYAWM